MQIHQADYIGSFVDPGSCPQDHKPEYAFIGRSNVGKSSLINMLTGRRNLARTSSSPGKTQTINYFLIDDAWYLVDLPGYGFAKAAQRQRRQWAQMIEAYIRQRRNLVCLFVLIDSRIPPQQKDLEFIDTLGEGQIPFCLVFTKTDKNTQRETARNVQAFIERMKLRWESLPPYFQTSAVSKTGRDDLLELIEEYNLRFGSVAGDQGPE
jgi:GTP-binding protein